MLKYTLRVDPTTQETVIATPYKGKALLSTPWFNKGTAFSLEERLQLGLIGKLPAALETLDMQVKRCYEQFNRFHTPIERHIFLGNLHEINQILFYRVVSLYLDEMLPVMYTPVISEAVKLYSTEFRRPRGLYISYPEIDYIDEILKNRTHPDIRLIVATDGEGVLGIGDQGVGGMCIPIAKLMVYSLCGGIDPVNTLPIMLDVGTNNETLLNDPLYVGWRHPRITGAEYLEFMDKFVSAVKRHFPDVFLHWEDFGRDNSRLVLDRYRQEICSFNDDIEGTGCVAVAAFFSAVEASGIAPQDHRIIIFGAGTAGCGIADQLFAHLVHLGIAPEQAKKQFWLIDKNGLVIDETGVPNFQQPYARAQNEWPQGYGKDSNLTAWVTHIKPTALIGCSTVQGAFSESVVKGMLNFCERPIIFPLSNPNEKCEAFPADILRYTQGKALVATGSPFAPVTVAGDLRPVAQCNNALAFPGIGLGILAAKATTLTPAMLKAASQVLLEHAPIRTNPQEALLPSLKQARDMALKIGLAVATTAAAQGVAQNSGKPEDWVKTLIWEPSYRKIVPL